MHRDPLQNVAGTSSTAFYWKWNFDDTPKAEPWTNLSEYGFLSVRRLTFGLMDLRKMGYRPRSTHLILMRYCANATASGFPVMVIVRSVAPPSLSSQLLIRIMAPEIWRISAILVPPFPMMQPISSFGTVISCVWLFAAGCCLFVLLVRSWLPANAANAMRPSIAQILEKFLPEFWS